ncbi:unnamed protein product [Paramecium sonneborni]|uniref:Transmembrane protein n=1 Tax=Paramecium sonneborni TaxID=65129 RepID=A0A8S1KBB0_9CILI|nr:unnamed protein product [Paramecium sonneborni]
MNSLMIVTLIILQNTFQNKYLFFQKSFDWQPLLTVLGAAAKSYTTQNLQLFLLPKIQSLIQDLLQQYLNLQFEILFQDYGIHEYIWDDETPYIQLIISFFEGIFVSVLLSITMNMIIYFLKAINQKCCIYHIMYGQPYFWECFNYLKYFNFKILNQLFTLMFLWNVQINFLVEFSLNQLQYIQQCFRLNLQDIFNLILSQCIMCLLYRSTENARDQKNKLFYLSFMNFFNKSVEIHSQRRILNNSNDVLCAERLSLVEFLKVLSQILCTHMIVNYDQLRKIKFNHFGKSPFLILDSFYFSISIKM